MDLLDKALGQPLSREEACQLINAQGVPLLELMHAAASLREAHKGRTVTYSRKVFIPLTTMCRDDCGYCTFKHDPGHPGASMLSPEQVLDIARRGEAQGCKEALFSLGDKPELRFPEAAQSLAGFGYKSTAAYLAAMCRLVLEETGLLPHANPGTVSKKEIAVLRDCNGSMGIMLENLTPRLRLPGMAHEHAPDKAPKARLSVLRHAGELRFPFTTGLLIGIGETPVERVDTLFAIKEMHEAYGHIQEVIIQNFRAKPDIPMADWPDASFPDLLRTVAVARLVLGGGMNVQAPPNLTPEAYAMLLLAGINDWGGVSPVTPDHINPEAPWPEIEVLARRSAEVGYTLRERLTLYPEFITPDSGFVPDALRGAVVRLADAEGYAIPHERQARHHS
ncbi:MAG: 7,8-didemethyl-8-hydroxy-5-deazariboflavin synthase CofG [SAR324 cluster bacterium]|nr:7,8-didemethyl-8-hydroxy-5-deazariboflavin synthase CofG [SAR324 cluster bacterium]MCZ6557153.1 7,8-didemethyl-8-hydroxy-5-deazariboflavin synthase CofG [SAR324 cluster bacterium]MCZ6626981.1 7,8-didemethyl-8-hydroxy-5-deazariboflavin synthase CofG [SAR324 cluster bacterium]MCZ6645511.1 7,8-didemethyl-8-hydroxy-5-deazariboflavin synthase CofG [SAR324 cluster bacterium]MCZ6728939.1 7,8-didemethyl-8-hydroxy-5-deazariboflavin synthase CofG [SAR324 cluster bacterium]